MEIYSSLLSQLKNAWQYIFVGFTWLFVLLMGVNLKYLLPLLLISTGIAGFVPSIIKKIKFIYYDKIGYKKSVADYVISLDKGERAVMDELVRKNVEGIQEDIVSNRLAPKYEYSQEVIKIFYDMKNKGLGRLVHTNRSITFIARKYTIQKYKDLHFK